MGARTRIAGMLVLSLAGLAAAASGAEDPRRREPTSWDVALSPPGEPGEPFEMSGLLRSTSGEVLPNRKMFFYHADSKGRYTLTSNGPLHLAAVLRTDAKGRYRIRSVFPGGYSGFPPHVHFEVLDEPHGAGTVNVRREGKTTTGAFLVTAHRDAGGVWRLKTDVQARPTVSAAAPDPPRIKVPEIRYPPPGADSLH